MVGILYFLPKFVFRPKVSNHILIPPYVGFCLIVVFNHVLFSPTFFPTRINFLFYFCVYQTFGSFTRIKNIFLAMLYCKLCIWCRVGQTDTANMWSEYVDWLFLETSLHPDSKTVFVFAFQHPHRRGCTVLHHALDGGVWRTISYFSLKIDCLALVSF